jgi:hypothetical protein
MLSSLWIVARSSALSSSVQIRCARIESMREILEIDRVEWSGKSLEQVARGREGWWKIGFIYVEKLSKRCCIKFRLLYKYDIGCCSFAG